MINFLQVNHNGCWVAEQLLAQTTIDTDADVLILSELFAKCGRENRRAFSLDRRAAVGIPSRSGCAFSDKGSGTGFAWTHITGIIVYSCYWRPVSTLAEFSSFLDNLADSNRLVGGDRVIVYGDFNAWNVEEGSRVNNQRGIDPLVNENLRQFHESITETEQEFSQGTSFHQDNFQFATEERMSDWTVDSLPMFQNIQSFLTPFQ
ncbi:hypothetical protein AGLY_014104 [Aphis glycines]|uniref:Endonuclease/exonuclease/phosphatase domain-containing protein n=1 Tax=Aphis glycines TaxID=307491 RepID=A0A6G0T450_APHGL|nr:hypothetical protein AGLY_014104 [Aphis glycines]